MTSCKLWRRSMSNLQARNVTGRPEAASPSFLYIHNDQSVMQASTTATDEHHEAIYDNTAMIYLIFYLCIFNAVLCGLRLIYPIIIHVIASFPTIHRTVIDLRLTKRARRIAGKPPYLYKSRLVHPEECRRSYYGVASLSTKTSPYKCKLHALRLALS